MAIRIIRESPLCPFAVQQYPRQPQIQRLAGLNQQTMAILGRVVAVGAVVAEGGSPPGPISTTQAKRL